MDALSTTATAISVLLGLGALGTVVFKFWGVPDRLSALEQARQADQAQAQAKEQAKEQALVTRLGSVSTTSQAAVSQVQAELGKRLVDLDAYAHASRAELFSRINDLQAQITANKLEAATAMTAIREIQNGIREKFQTFERMEAAISAGLQLNAEKKAEISRLKDDYQQLNDLVQRLNREIGELRAGCVAAHRERVHK